MKRWQLIPVAVLALVTASFGQDDPKKVIEKAVAAHGGAATINKYGGVKITSEDSIFIAGQELASTNELLIGYPNKQRNTSKVSIMGVTSVVVEKISPAGHSMTVDGAPQEVLDVTKKGAAMGFDKEAMLRLTPLLSDNSFTLKSLGTQKDDDKEFIVIEASGKSLKSAKMYFDPATSLLTKFEFKGPSPKEVGKESVHVMTFSSFKETSGIKKPHKMVMNVDGERFMVQMVKEIQHLEKVDDAEFR